ncbi:MAG: hypothetical protein JGK24_16110 [Microcoleus sp. PH2017_29_MFU_D_A]|uniref:hypothetical protein n=1 Tax=Microcoleus sp. PH2017_29_MFU_D_A TaxID=2798839 RepID=UPI001DD42531|nr:hypothetical protein [Microcoleus sp. PH2017_29_MFU_D_A]MCC3604699.1 hypothetical protein [Microcoleus sp. PH2017_29_MFU_D_A]
MAVGSWQLAVGSWQLAVGSWQLAVGSWQLCYNPQSYSYTNLKVPATRAGYGSMPCALCLQISSSRLQQSICSHTFQNWENNE